jgi:hypothetical protein
VRTSGLLCCPLSCVHHKREREREREKEREREREREPLTMAGRRLEQSVNDKLHRKVSRAPNELESLGTVLTVCGMEYGVESAFGARAHVCVCVCVCVCVLDSHPWQAAVC